MHPSISLLYQIVGVRESVIRTDAGLWGWQCWMSNMHVELDYVLWNIQLSLLKTKRMLHNYLVFYGVIMIQEKRQVQKVQFPCLAALLLFVPQTLYVQLSTPTCMYFPYRATHESTVVFYILLQIFRYFCLFFILFRILVCNYKFFGFGKLLSPLIH